MIHYTPGPWKTDEADHTEPLQDIRIMAGTWAIARVWIDDAPNQYDVNATQRANARLIAKAPEMADEIRRLRALNAELAEALKVADAALDEDSNGQVRLEASGFVRAAIAKAEREG